MISKPASKTKPKGSDAAGQRLDKWLWFARVAKTRTLATQLVESGKARVNRVKVNKASRSIRPGDVITLAIHGRIRVLKVLACGERRGCPTEAHELYEDMSPPPPRETATVTAAAPAHREKGAGRPTKRDRRRMDAWRMTSGDPGEKT